MALNGQKPLTQRVFEQMNRGGFSGGVSELGLPMREVPRSRSGRVIEKVVHSGNSDPTKSPAIVARLLHLSPISPQLAKQRDRLVADLFPLLTEAEELEKVLVEYRQTTLESQLTDLRARCRKQKGLCDSLRGKLQAAEIRLMNAMAQSENEIKLLQGLRDLKSEGRALPMWPTADEVEEFEILYAKHQEKVAKANEHVAAALTSRNAWLFEVEPEERNMGELIAEEARLNSEVNNEPFIDLELGLGSVPSGFTND
jgi:hypothetical protein